MKKMTLREIRKYEWYTGDVEVVGQREKNKKDKEIAETLEKKQLPKWKEVKMKKSFYLYVWDTIFSVWFSWHDYRLINLSNNKISWLSPWEEKTLWREWEIRVDKTDTQASREHLKLRVDDDGNLFLCDNSKHWTFVDEVENSEGKKETMKCEKMTAEEINEFKSSKKTREAEHLYQQDERCRPKNKIDMRNWMIIYATEILQADDKEEILGYIKDGEYMDLRMFYKSESEWIWRSCPGVTKSEHLSKWECIKNYCYETTTKVETQLWNIFDWLERILSWDLDDPIMVRSKEKWYNILMDKMIKETKVDTLFTNSEFRDIIIKQAEIWIKEDADNKKIYEDLIKKCENFRNEWKFLHSISSSIVNFHDRDGKLQRWWIDDVKRMYERAVPSELNYMNMNYKESYTYKNDNLWIIQTDIYQASRSWRLVDIYFSRAESEPNLVWIDDIQYPDAEINSFWIMNKSINAVPLVWKPIDYRDQSPYNLKDHIHLRKWWNYVDMRNLYQDNPIIKHYKKLEWLL